MDLIQVTLKEGTPTCYLPPIPLSTSHENEKTGGHGPRSSRALLLSVRTCANPCPPPVPTVSAPPPNFPIPPLFITHNLGGKIVKLTHNHKGISSPCPVPSKESPAAPSRANLQPSKKKIAKKQQLGPRSLADRHVKDNELGGPADPQVGPGFFTIICIGFCVARVQPHC